MAVVHGPPLTPNEARRAYFVEVRRAIGILLRATVAYFACSYADLLPPEALTAMAGARWSEPTVTGTGV